MRRFLQTFVVSVFILIGVMGVFSASGAKEMDTKTLAAAKHEVDESVMTLVRQHAEEGASGITLNKIIHGDPDRKEVAITFDDGPHPGYTPKLLAILKQYNAKATFFLVGEKVEEYPDLVRAEFQAGHSIGNHTYHHVNLTKIPISDVAIEILADEMAIKKVTGVRPHLFRPPGGDYDRNVAKIVNTLGYTLVLWSINPGDYEQPGEGLIEERVLRKIHGGSIILLHDGVQQTVDVLPTILEYLKMEGYRCVTVDEMLKHR